jgi:hypothetical protein
LKFLFEVISEILCTNTPYDNIQSDNEVQTFRNEDLEVQNVTNNYPNVETPTDFKQSLVQTVPINNSNLKAPTKTISKNDQHFNPNFKASPDYSDSNKILIPTNPINEPKINTPTDSNKNVIPNIHIRISGIPLTFHPTLEISCVLQQSFTLGLFSLKNKCYYCVIEIGWCIVIIFLSFVFVCFLLI